MQVHSYINKYNPRNPNRRSVEKRVTESKAHYVKRFKNI